MGSKCEKYNDLITVLCESGASYSEIQEQLPEHMSTGTIWRYLKSLGMETKGINKAAFKKGNKVGEKKRKEITWELNENGCWIVTSHKLMNTGYAQTYLNGKFITIHRLMYEKHKGKIPRGMEVCHKCDTPSCCNPEHLFLGTHKQNMEDMAQKGRQTLGSRNPMAKLTESQVREMISLCHLKQDELASIFGVTQPAVSMILNDRRWTHV